jgi:hypothetical protein
MYLVERFFVLNMNLNVLNKFCIDFVVAAQNVKKNNPSGRAPNYKKQQPQQSHFNGKKKRVKVLYDFMLQYVF